MLGLGEEESEVYETLKDLRDAKVDIVTIGQYLQPSKNIFLFNLLLHLINSKITKYSQKN